MSSRALKMLGEGLAAEIELYECFWGNLGIYPPTQINGTLMRYKHSKFIQLHHKQILFLFAGIGGCGSEVTAWNDCKDW